MPNIYQCPKCGGEFKETQMSRNGWDYRIESGHSLCSVCEQKRIDKIRAEGRCPRCGEVVTKIDGFRCCGCAGIFAGG